jgi:hypothetical protein
VTRIAGNAADPWATRNRATHADRSLEEPLNSPAMPAVRGATQIARLATHRTALAMGARRTQTNRYGGQRIGHTPKPASAQFGGYLNPVRGKPWQVRVPAS